MTAKEKFENRLKELGLFNEWPGYGRFGKALKNHCHVFVHESDDDIYTESVYLSMEEISNNPILREKIFNGYDAIDDFNDETIGKLYRWKLNGGEFPIENCCVLYFALEPLWHCEFKDDKLLDGYGNIMDALNGHDKGLVGWINALYDVYGPIHFMNAIFSLFGTRPVDELDTIDRKLYEQIHIKDFVYEVLENWADDSDLKRIGNLVDIDTKYLSINNQ